MLVVFQVDAGVAGYFLDGRDLGRWSDDAQKLLGLEGPVQRSDLVRVLDGIDPRTGLPLQASRPRRRRGGWDLVFSAPKSVSLLSAANGEHSAGIGAAHAAAVGDVMAQVGRDLLTSGGGRGEGLIWAAFLHRANRAEEPHLHSHVLVANLTRTGQSWRSVDPGQWVIGRTALSGLYQLSLRHHLGLLRLGLEWRLRPDGLADLASVPRSAVRAASSQTAAVEALGRIEARRRATPQPWRERAVAAGLTPPPDRPASTDSTSGPAGRPPAMADDPRLERTVTTRLASIRSNFRREDVVAALAASHAGGATVDQALDWTDAFCRDALQVPSPTARPRWTTALARGADDELCRRMRSLGRPHHASRAVDRSAVRDVLQAAGALTAVQRETAERLALDDRPFTVIGAHPGHSGLLDRAELLSACRSVWTASGMSVAVDAQTAASALRWEVLTGIPAHRRDAPADVIVVDRAERRPTGQLVGLVAEAELRSATLVFVEGGTLPRLTAPASAGLSEIAGETATLACPRARPWEVPASAGRSNGPVLAGRAAAEEALGLWATWPGSALVGLGLDEAAGLNLAACVASRSGQAGAAKAAMPPGNLATPPGNLATPPGDIAMPPGRAPGDRVVVARRTAGLPAYGTGGTVTAGAPGSPTFEVDWDGDVGASRLPIDTTAVRPGWAVTAAAAALAGRPVVLLGPRQALSRGGLQIVHSVEPEPASASRQLAPARSRYP